MRRKRKDQKTRQEEKTPGGKRRQDEKNAIRKKNAHAARCQATTHKEEKSERRITRYEAKQAKEDSTRRLAELSKRLDFKRKSKFHFPPRRSDTSRTQTEINRETWLQRWWRSLAKQGDATDKTGNPNPSEANSAQNKKRHRQAVDADATQLDEAAIALLRGKEQSTERKRRKIAPGGDG